MMFPEVDVCLSGAVLLGPDVVCDGFFFGRDFRVQTHIHADHLTDFDTSKGIQTIYMSEATRELLVAELNADLSVRTNVVGVSYRRSVQCGASRVTLIHSGHMLGSAQVQVETAAGRFGYSGDFAWPLDEVIQADVLVIDSTYGSAKSVRQFTQERAEHEFYDLVNRRLPIGPVYLTAHRGTLQRALRVLGELRNCAVIASPRIIKELGVYQQYGYHVPPTIVAGTLAARQAIAAGGRVLRVFDGKDKLPVDTSDGTSIDLSAFGMVGISPVLEYSERGFRVALSDHADFNETIEYIQATGAKHVITNNTQGHGIELMQELRARLPHLEVRTSSNLHSKAWGQGS